MRRSFWCAHRPDWKSLEKVAGGEGVLTVAMASERLCDDWYVIGVRHGRWMGCRN